MLCGQQLWNSTDMGFPFKRLNTKEGLWVETLAKAMASANASTAVKKELRRVETANSHKHTPDQFSQY